MLRKARKQKFQDHCHETRQRSLSVGSEACWYNRHLQQQQQNKLEQSQQQQQQQLGDVVDGVQLRNPQKSTAAASSVLAQRHRNSAECWKTALNRNDLMSIIRESMEKNRLCFQMSGKPQANVSPIRQPQLQHQPPHSQQQLQQQQQQQQQRSNTVSKIPTLIANHNNAIINHSSSNNNNNNNNNHHHHHHHSLNNSHSNSNSSSHSHSSNHTNNNSSELNLHDISTTNNTNTTQYHPQPHIPIYHQQMAINPAVLAAQSGMQHGVHSKLNLCGYDSFLHATICGGGTSHSPPPTTGGNVGATTAITLVPPIVGNNQHTNQQQQQQQLIATVQPIMNAVPSSQSTPAKVFLNSTTHQIKTSKILRSGSYSQQHTPLHILTAHNSPQYSGYQRLSSSNAHHSHGHSHGHGHGGHQPQHQQCANKLAAVSLADAPLSHNSPAEHNDKWLKNNSAKQQRKESAMKYADNALYAKLSEKLQESALSTHNQRTNENVQRRKCKSAHKLRTQTACNAPATQSQSACAPNGIHSSSSNTSIGTYAALIPIHGDPAECENLIAPTTTDDEAVNEAPTALFYASCKTAAISTPKSKNTANAAVEPVNEECNVATAKLVDINDEAELVAVEAVEGVVEDPDMTLRVSDAAEVEEVDADDGEEDEEEEEEAETEERGDSANVANTSGGASSLIHRYVHEHIHHHYHHFEEKDE